MFIAKTTAVQPKALITMDKFIGANAFIDDPIEKMQAVGFIREYHSWRWDEGGAKAYLPYPENRMQFAPSAAGEGSWNFDRFYRKVNEYGLDVSPVIQGYVKLRVLKLHNWRTLTRLGRGITPGPESSISKLAWTDMTQSLSDTGLKVLGAASSLQDEGDHDLSQAYWQRQWLWSKAASIAGGTSEVQRTIIGDRILGLPR